MISVQSKLFKVHAAKLKGKFTNALKGDNDGNMDQKEEKNQFLYLQEHIGIIILKLPTLKISVGLSIQWLREEHDEELNATKDNGLTETIEEHDKLCQIMEDKKVMFWKLVRNETYSWINLRHCNRVLMNRG